MVPRVRVPQAAGASRFVPAALLLVGLVVLTVVLRRAGASGVPLWLGAALGTAALLAGLVWR